MLSLLVRRTGAVEFRAHRERSRSPATRRDELTSTPCRTGNHIKGDAPFTKAAGLSSTSNCLLLAAICRGGGHFECGSRCYGTTGARLRRARRRSLKQSQALNSTKTKSDRFPSARRSREPRTKRIIDDLPTVSGYGAVPQSRPCRLSVAAQDLRRQSGSRRDRHRLPGRRGARFAWRETAPENRR